MLRPLVLAIAVAGLAGSLGRFDVRAEYGPDAPPDIAVRLQQRLEADPSPLYGALPADLKGRAFSMDIREIPRGVDVALSIQGTPRDAEVAARAIARPLSDIAQEEGGDFAEKTTVTGSTFTWPTLPRLRWPHLELPQLGLPKGTLPAAGSNLHLGTMARAIAGSIAAFGAAALLVGFLRRRGSGPSNPKSPPAKFWGSPVLGLLPESLARVGKLYHLQSKPCQALSHFFGQQAEGTREVVIAGEVFEAAATVAVCLGLFLARQQDRVLLVDMSQDDPVIPSILARFGPGQDKAEGGASSTGIPDLDLFSAQAPGGELPEIPEDLARRYERILFVAPAGERPADRPVVDVLGRAGFSAGLKLAFRRNRLGCVFFGGTIPDRLSDRYFTRYYFERLQDTPDDRLISRS